HHVLVLDHSYSMGVQPEGAQSPYEKMRHLTGQLLERLEGRAGQKVTVVHAGVRPEMPLRDDLNLGRAKAELAAMPGPQDSAADLTAALLRTADVIEEGGDGDVRVYVFTDLQARAFGRELTAAGAEAPA